ncbi:hypothetical protein EMIT0P171_150082 [Pseudomonas sp. IT-P171]
MNIAGQGHGYGVISRFDGLHKNPRTVLFNLGFFAAGTQQDKEAQANHSFQSGTSHADSFALYERANGDTTVSLEQGSTGAQVCCTLSNQEASHAQNPRGGQLPLDQ